MAVSVDRFKYTFIGALPPSLGLNQLKTIITVSLCCLLLIVVLSGGGGWNAGRGETTPLEPEVGIEWKSLIHRNGSNVDVFEEMSIVSPDGSANATFIALGATLKSLFVKDATGVFRDVVLGYDNTTSYVTDPAYAYFGAVVGRYANRIRNSSFAMPPKQNLSLALANGIHHVSPNENDHNNTLHGGYVGWSRSGFQVLSHTKSQIVFGLLDRGGTEGFPGSVYARVIYTLKTSATFITELSGHAFEDTPLSLSSHVYWNLDGYNGSESILDHSLFLKGRRWIETDSILVPTGTLGKIKRGSPMDFRLGKKIGADMARTANLCGPGCVGYDTCFIYDRARNVTEDVVMTLSSPVSGIKLSIKTDQPAVQVYTCNGLDSTIPRKESHGGPKKTYKKHSCIVLEQQGWIDGINQPQWGQNQIYGPGRPYFNWWSEYKFSIL